MALFPSNDGLNPPRKRKSIEDMDSNPPTTHFGLDVNTNSQNAGKCDDGTRHLVPPPPPLVHKYAPTFDIAVLYARLAKSYRRFYHTNTVAVVNILSNLLNKPPVDLLLECRSYQLAASKKQGKQKRPFGFLFRFATTTFLDNSRRRVSASSTPDTKKVVDQLKIELQCLQQRIHISGDNNFIKIGRKKASKNDPDEVEFGMVAGNDPYLRIRNECDSQMQIPFPPEKRRKLSEIEESGPITKLGEVRANQVTKPSSFGSHSVVPLLSGHKMTSFESRIWSEIEARAICLYVHIFVFETALGKDGICVLPSEYLSFSYRTTCNLAEKVDFFEYLAEICLFFGDRKQVENERVDLIRYWERRSVDKAGTQFQAYIQRNLSITVDPDRHVQAMDECFEIFRQKKKSKQYGLGGRLGTQGADEWWQCIRANTFRLYLSSGKRARDLKEKLLILQESRQCQQGSLPKSQPKNQTRTSRITKRTSTDSAHLKVASNGVSQPRRDGIHNPMMTPAIAVNTCSLQDLGSGVTGNLPGSKKLDLLVEESEEFSRVIIAPPVKDKQRSISCERPSNGFPETAVPCEGDTAQVKSSLHLLRQKSFEDLTSNLRLASQQDLTVAGVNSEFLIQHPQQSYHLYLAPVELYVATGLSEFKHGRIVGAPLSNQKASDKLLSPTEAHVCINTGKHEYIDPSNILHVARLGSEIMKSAPELGIASLFHVLLVDGKNDMSRSQDSLRIHVAAASSRNVPDHNGMPPSVGMGHDSNLWKQKNLRRSCGEWLSFMWKCSNELRRKAGQASMSIRSTFSDRMKKYFHIPEETEMGFESFHLCLQEISPFPSRNKLHFDDKNCTLLNSSQTAALDFCIVDQATQKIYLMQMIANFRKVVTSHVMPMYETVSCVADRFRIHRSKINQELARIYRDQNLPFVLPTAMDRSNIYLDNSLEYERESLLPNKGTSIAKVGDQDLFDEDYKDEEITENRSDSNLEKEHISGEELEELLADAEEYQADFNASDSSDQRYTSDSDKRSHNSEEIDFDVHSADSEISEEGSDEKYDQDKHEEHHENITTEKQNRGNPSIEVLKIFQSFSRYLGASSALHVLNLCHGRMSFRQIIELSFVCSQLNNPYRFYYVMNDLLSEKNYEFDEYPFNDWYRRTKEIFGETKILGGRNPRFSVAGIADIGALFGSGAKDGNQKLKKIVDVLEGYLEWVDGLRGLEKPHNIPAELLHDKMSEVAKDVTSAGGKTFKDFGLFRLSVFLTHAIGACLTRPGKHLRQVVLPHVGTASSSHLKCGASDVLTHAEANVQAGVKVGAAVSNKTDEVFLKAFGYHNFDEFSELLHKELGIKEVFRDFTEVVLCETRPNRTLNLKDWLIRGIPLYDLDNNGCMVCKLPGKLERWEIMEAHNPILKDEQLHLRYEYHEKCLQLVVEGMAKKAREDVIRLSPRKQGCVSHIDDRSSLSKDLFHFYHETTLYAYEGHSDTEHQQGMRVLANNGLQPVQFKSKNVVRFQSMGKGTEVLVELVKKNHTVPNFKGRLAGCFHMQKIGGGGEKGMLSYYDVHKDKAAFDWVTFIPLSSEFFTLTATPKGVIDHMCVNDTLELKDNVRKSNEKFQDFMSGLNKQQNKGVVEYMNSLKKSANRDYKCDVELQAWFCAPGTSLTFPAKNWWHGTITKNGDTLRDLLILHPMVN